MSSPVNETRNNLSKRIAIREDFLLGVENPWNEEINRRNSERSVVKVGAKIEGHGFEEWSTGRHVVERQSLFRGRQRCRRRLVPTSTRLIVVPTRNSNVKLLADG